MSKPPSLKSTSRFFPFEATGHEAVELLRVPLLILSVGRVLFLLLGLAVCAWNAHRVEPAKILHYIQSLRS